MLLLQYLSPRFTGSANWCLTLLFYISGFSVENGDQNDAGQFYHSTSLRISVLDYHFENWDSYITLMITTAVDITTATV